MIDCCGHEAAIRMANERAERWRARTDEARLLRELAESRAKVNYESWLEECDRADRAEAEVAALREAMNR